MYLRKLHLLNFKNYPQAEFEFSKKVNCILGNNGIGKTNLLDAIYYLSFCKSFLNPSDTQNISHQSSMFLIQGVYHSETLPVEEDEITCGQKKGSRKQFKRNKKDYDRLSDHIGLIPLVLISPADIDIIVSGSEERRRFVDSVISQFDRSYLEDIISYNKALLQRNSLLKDFSDSGNIDIDSLEIWNEQMIGPGTRIYEKRKIFIEDFVPSFSRYYSFISGQREIAGISYISDLNETSFDVLLKESVNKDVRLEYTSKGIHKDDLELLLDGYPVKKYGSQGQQKSFLVSIKLAEFDHMMRLTQKKPILLLDDIYDKLDDARLQKLMGLVGEGHFGQVFITDTHPHRIPMILDELKVEYIKQDIVSHEIKNADHVR